MASRQAVCKRCKPSALLFVQAIFEDFLAQQISSSSQTLPVAFRGYTRVIVADSTLIKLPAWLFEIFSGTANATTQSCHCRIQAAYDLIAMKFIYFSIDPYSKNDQAAAPELVLEKGDLVIRDRGYLTSGEIQRHLLAEANCIYRHMTGFTYLEPESNLAFDLLAHLRQHGKIDKIVRLNNTEGTLVRLVGAAIDEESANLRRMRCKKEAHGHNPSKTVLALMSWTVYLVTDGLRTTTFEEIMAIYGLRWRIEIIFKSWKSEMAFAKVHHLSETQLRILLTIRLMMIVAYTDMLYGPSQRKLKKETGRELSLLKFIRYLTMHPSKILQFLKYIAEVEVGERAADESKAQSLKIRQLLVKYCCYDKRKRLNFNNQWDSVA